MTDREKEFENLIRDIRFDDVPDYNHREKLEQNLLATLKAQSRHNPKTLRIWRIIMKSSITKFAAAAFVVVLLVGVCQIDATRAAFARTTKIVSTGLAGLKAFIMDMKTREQESPSTVPPADSSKQKVVFEGRSILANVYTFSVKSENRSLQDFLKRENIKWTPAGNNQDAWYAELGPGKGARFIALAQSDAGMELISSPSLMVREGEEGVIGSVGTEGQDAVALSLVTTIPDDDDSINLSFSFLHGQNGFEVPSLRISIGDAVLFRLATAGFNQNDQNDQDRPEGQDDILVLVWAKVFP